MVRGAGLCGRARAAARARRTGEPAAVPACAEHADRRDSFGEVVQVDRLREAIPQSRTLATLRDTLLPKLLSGELSVAGNELLK